jgi:DNA-nicking Smr family endonuclease
MPASPRDVGPEERDLFAEAVADVAPIAPTHRLPEIVWREPTPISEREREVLRELDALVSGESPFELHQSDEFMEGAVPGLDPRMRARLRAGEFTSQAEIDLHGLVARDARAQVERFVVDAHRRGLRCVRIVHGRGRNSPGGEAVLKPSLPRWLARGPARLRVLAYASARPADGGTGALYVLLRKGLREPDGGDPRHRPGKLL